MASKAARDEQIRKAAETVRSGTGWVQRAGSVTVPVPERQGVMVYATWREALVAAHEGIETAKAYRQRMFRAAQEAGITTREIASAVGISPAGVSRICAHPKAAGLEHEQDGEDAGGPSLDEVYAERNKVVLAFAALVKEQGWDVGLAVDPDSPDWPVLMIETDAGQVSWHFQAGELPPGLPLFAGKWDGHSTPEKYDRLAELVRSAFGLGEIAQDGDTEETT